MGEAVEEDVPAPERRLECGDGGGVGAVQLPKISVKYAQISQNIPKIWSNFPKFPSKFRTSGAPMVLALEHSRASPVRTRATNVRRRSCSPAARPGAPAGALAVEVEARDPGLGHVAVGGAVAPPLLRQGDGPRQKLVEVAVDDVVRPGLTALAVGRVVRADLGPARRDLGADAGLARREVLRLRAARRLRAPADRRPQTGRR